MSNLVEEKETRERLLKNVKRECKQLMEIAVTKKFINEDSSCITSLCATIESCLLHGLKRRGIGIFNTGTTISILQKISKNSEQAKLVLELCDEYDKTYCSKSQSEKSLISRNSQQSLFSRKIFSNSTENSSNSSQLVNGRNFSPTFYKGSNCYRFLWIRIALLNKCLIKIIDCIISEANNFYQPYALLADPVDGPIFNSLLIGPCALEYTQMKSCEHLWNDPNADELIQRHKMHNSGNLCSNSYNPISIYSQSSSALITQTPNPFNRFKFGLNSTLIKRKASISNVFDDISNLNTFINNNNQIDKNGTAQSNTSNSYLTPKDCMHAYIPPSPSSIQSNLINHSAKEYVESLHQNSKSQIIYGKNHVIVNQREKEIAGYLSLHLNSNGLVLKWTPNQIMNGSSPIEEALHSSKTKTAYWDYALNIDMNTIVYLHCHQQASLGATIVLVAQDGVQHPSIIFPKGSHLLQFLTCLESGLAPNGQLDPALWNDNGKGKVFPKLPRKTMKKYQSDCEVSIESESLGENENSDSENQEDFVFRIINSKSNVSVTTVSSEVANKKKLEFSLSAGNKIESSKFVNTFMFNKNNHSKLSSLFSSFTKKNLSLDENQPVTFNINESLKAPPPSLSSQNSIYNSFDSSYASSISPSSIVLDKTSNNNFNILSKIDNLRQHSICDFEITSNEFYQSDSLARLKQLSAR
ncbi:unnamed protein product [Brachionus calyciflorus]|uniref:RUN domain-containing protein n=1 Tax=Brachionus calyciflorus TaxID=104777 RepID=A0A814B272_9BILA|nr:unnamed protein product [Brachionus calyciflorus]